jgi:hypothetical protein
MISPATTQEMSRHRYGDTRLWVLERNLGGSRAGRLLEQMDQHFEQVSGHLLLDLRGASFIDSAGAEALERAALRHPGLAVVGFPREYENLPRRTRASLRILRPAGTLEKAFASLNDKTQDSTPWRNRRRYCRIPAAIPVEIIFGTRTAASTIHDVSLGGGRLGRLPSSWIREIRRGVDTPDMIIAGMDHDPLGREISHRFETNLLSSHPVHLLPEGAGLGIRFSDPPAIGPR